MNVNEKLSCDGFLPADSSSSVQSGLYYSCAKKVHNPFEDSHTKTKSSTLMPDDISNKCPAMLGTSSTLPSKSSGILQQECRLPRQPLPDPPNIAYELAVAKSIMQQYSTISGDNLFDHLSDIIKRVIDERPPNVIDFFEEFSRNVREQKLHLPESFPPDAVFEETPLYKVAQKQLASMKLPYTNELEIDDEDIEEEHNQVEDYKLEVKLRQFRPFHERVQHLQFFWNQCGFSISSDDIFQLACSMDRLQTHPSIEQCRFWGIINGLKSSYYIVEACLTNEECVSRLLQMENEIRETRKPEILKQQKLPSHIGPELTPGAVGWENYPEEELFKMKSHALPIPLVKVVEVFDIPPEPFGKGVNRYTYFVVNSLSDDWIELPLLTPKQIIVSRKIKKFLTGDLEADIISYPCFPGKEKHYLRAMISRITSATYIAPENYCRKMTKQERFSYENGYVEENEDEGDEGDEEEESEISEHEEEIEANNDVVLIKNDKYDSNIPLNTLNKPSKWVHVRPNILEQGRVVWYDEEKSRREREKEGKRMLGEGNDKEGEEEGDEDEESNEDEESDEEADEKEDVENNREIGPSILTPCSSDTYKETPVPWVGRFTSRFTNKNERILMMKSTVWPGACTFIFENLCDSIYLGWGHKYVSRNMNWQHFTPIAEEYHHSSTDFIESIDPSVEMEELYRLSLMKKEINLNDVGEQVDDYENETNATSDSDEDEDDDDKEEK